MDLSFTNEYLLWGISESILETDERRLRYFTVFIIQRYSQVIIENEKVNFDSFHS